MDKIVSAQFIINELLSIANSEKAEKFQYFFKTGKGQYAEGDIMLGIPVPFTRNVVKNCHILPLSEILILLDSEYHEIRLSGFLLLVKQYKKADLIGKKEIFDFYIENAHKANNWDLVDLTCKDIIGLYLSDKKDRNILYKLAENNNLWEQRISIVSTWTFIKNNQFDDTLALSEKLITHKHDLIHKAIGWMLREVGKKNKTVLVDFLEANYKKLPRTALQYSIEHFSPEERAYYIKKQKVIKSQKNVQKRKIF
ncbi:MAG: DNA alkylation repair protein [Bacteroidales bacterium]|jgi:3-methyladenine DNA glycosylase AlkD|nr:DNA alkylation repair protein [Bacteroidales bacterium]